ncbi:hypothetical protein FOQG_14945 [Fusarium oxysporum f. sp. raphani 54005]|uniref:N-acetyltransferase domain-containing protein n=1 Tax=Fusarium oxysporum f. sp. raphani 54005 TaxID=1089458 RepID=X0BEC4_FUSOX|nr:hypothetical protein FOQG_14945 [Fusarium oxysporum f. sp. raphani 54005]
MRRAPGLGRLLQRRHLEYNRRTRRVMELNSSSVGRAVAAGEEVPERLFAFIASTNAGSIGVMRKLGFCKFKDWEVLDSRAGYEGQMVTLVGFLLQRPIE